MRAWFEQLSENRNMRVGFFRQLLGDHGTGIQFEILLAHDYLHGTEGLVGDQ